MPPVLQTSGRHSIRKDNCFELPGCLCGKLFLKARRCFFGLLFFYSPLQDTEIKSTERLELEKFLPGIILYDGCKEDGKIRGMIFVFIRGS
jgi:hypothetical protein